MCDPSLWVCDPSRRLALSEDRLTGCVPIAVATRVVTVRGMSYPSDLTEQWELLEPVFNAPGKRGRKHADDLRGVVDAMLDIAQTGWVHLPRPRRPLRPH